MLSVQAARGTEAKRTRLRKASLDRVELEVGEAVVKDNRKPTQIADSCLASSGAAPPAAIADAGRRKAKSSCIAWGPLLLGAAAASSILRGFEP
jgi:hypothetical protein